MKLLSCHVENYGAIKNYDCRFNENLTEFLWDNGAGKSTLCSFIKAMFYGLPSVTGRTRFNERQHYYPFGGGKFGGNLTFLHCGKEYRIERFFDEKSEARDSCKLYCNGNAVDSGDIGRKFLGVDEESFVRTAFISADEIEMSSTASINAKLNNFVDGTDGFEEAVSALDRAGKNLKASRGGGEIAKFNDKIRNLQEEIANLKTIESALDGLYVRRNELEEAGNATSEKPKKPLLLVTVIAILIAVAGIGLLFVSTLVGAVLMAIGGLLFVGAVILNFKPRTKKIDCNYANQREIARFDADIERDERKVAILPDRLSELERAQIKLEELNKKYGILSAAKGFLEQAEQNLKDKYISPVKSDFNRYSKALESALGEKISMDKDFKILFERGGEYRGDGHLSSGQRAVCALCFRLALIDNMYGGEKPFIILDDPFLSLDAEHIKRAVRLLKNFSDRQIIYFCCHESRSLKAFK